MFTEIFISRTPCMGDCPEYQVIVNNIGNVQWNGQWSVYHLGKADFNITKSKIKKIEMLLKEFDYRSFTYPEPDMFATDQPSCITKVIFDDGFVKEIDHYLGDTQSYDKESKHSIANLEKFEKKLEQILGLRKYIKHPPFYLYYLKCTTCNGYESVISAPNENQAIQLATEHHYHHQWEVKKIGKDVRNTCMPHLVIGNS
ncbi:hypothetical protein GCM10011351_09800 [Paraliobacillus quinghaiensis]|uniref:DUF6438 domain-containing protein n=1 Tax=Paraliobacillus quinghaiensis TaxID=470815 RepID=A0A917WRV0_9BACI|nr:DUF6438 domain-containing protein [Paraliobacillus quinghaiensis]GGM26199.1 hypothetical protein GCM10011351_09800 [Paraliobacillus quinghaiensis]